MCVEEIHVEVGENSREVGSLYRVGPGIKLRLSDFSQRAILYSPSFRNFDLSIIIQSLKINI